MVMSSKAENGDQIQACLFHFFENLYLAKTPIAAVMFPSLRLVYCPEGARNLPKAVFGWMDRF